MIAGLPKSGLPFRRRGKGIFCQCPAADAKGGKGVAAEIVVEGKSLEEARAKAAAQLGCDPEDLELEVIAETRPGLLSRGRVQVRAYLKQEALDGLVGISGGLVVITDPKPGGRPAMLGPGAHVRLYVNDLAVRDVRAVSSADRVRLEGEVVEAETSVAVEVSEDGLTCTARVRRQPREVYAVEDAAPSNRLVAQARLVERVVPPLSEEEVLQRLAAAGVRYGIDREAIALAIERGDGEPVVVARGDPPVPPVDAEVEYPFLEKSRVFEAAVPGQRRIFSVEPGEVLAVKKPGRPGTPGRDVYGRVLEPPPPRDVTLRAGAGAALRQDGLAVVATVVGRPERRGNLVTVVPVYVIPGNADPRGGPIKFRGDVVVEGDVPDGVVIEAGGDVRVKGLVANSTIAAGGSIIVGGNVVGSRLRGGGLAVLWEKWETYWQETEEMLEELLAAVEQLRQQWESTRQDRPPADGVLVQACLQGRFRRLPGLIEQSAAALEEVGGALGLEAGHPLVEHMAYLRRCLSPSGSLALNTLAELVDRVEGAKAEAQALKGVAGETAQKVQIAASYVQNSVLETTGQVVISGKGCYNCSIYAGGGVVIDGSPGAFRGGQIISRGHVRVRQLGSEAEAKTYVQVPKRCYIKAGEAFPGVLLKAGSKVEKVTARMAVNLLGE